MQRCAESLISLERVQSQNYRTGKMKKTEPGFRKPLRRLIAMYGSYAALAHATGIHRAQIRALMTKIVEMRGFNQAILFEKASIAKGKPINRVEFFPELFHKNAAAIPLVEKMVRSRR